jgi:hypothetical protein
VSVRPPGSMIARLPDDISARSAGDAPIRAFAQLLAVLFRLLRWWPDPVN